MLRNPFGYAEEFHVENFHSLYGIILIIIIIYLFRYVYSVPNQLFLKLLVLSFLFFPIFFWKNLQELSVCFLYFFAVRLQKDYNRIQQQQTLIS